MSGLPWLAIAPLLVLSGGAVLLMVLVSIRRSLGVAWLTTVATALVAVLSCIPALEATPAQITPLLTAD